MKSFKLVFLGLLSLFLSACETMQPKVTTQYVVVSPSSDLMADCPIATPPNKEEYLSASVAKREELLYNLSMEQYKNIQKCNIQMKKLRKWKTEQEAIYKEKPLD